MLKPKDRRAKEHTEASQASGREIAGYRHIRAVVDWKVECFSDSDETHAPTAKVSVSGYHNMEPSGACQLHLPGHCTPSLAGYYQFRAEDTESKGLHWNSFQGKR